MLCPCRPPISKGRSQRNMNLTTETRQTFSYMHTSFQNPQTHYTRQYSQVLKSTSPSPHSNSIKIKQIANYIYCVEAGRSSLHKILHSVSTLCVVYLVQTLCRILFTLSMPLCVEALQALCNLVRALCVPCATPLCRFVRNLVGARMQLCTR